MKFRKRPIVIEAQRFDGTNCIDLLKWMQVPGWDNPELHPTDFPVIHTLEGDMVAGLGDWIIKGVNGEFYPCKDEIFRKTYEAIEG